MQSAVAEQKAYSGRSNQMLFSTGRASEQSFALQYTSLILIILTFIVGALIRPHLPPVAEVSGAIKHSQPEIASISYRKLFVGDSLDPAVPGALVTFAMNHDVHLRIDMFGELSDPPENRIARALSRSVTLQRHLIDNGVLPEALSVLAHGSKAEAQATVRISHMEEESR